MANTLMGKNNPQKQDKILHFLVFFFGRNKAVHHSSCKRHTLYSKAKRGNFLFLTTYFYAIYSNGQLFYCKYLLGYEGNSEPNLSTTYDKVQ